ncbi:hypothetical protein CGLO_11973 [Colletotrichum gloeosporioides Cg-14]|uniref:Uncharacterized protein n=1 Tax=Colletotrichum gloeosporioides (strain Cg-14) TaxID=1237896 RepID=T0JZG9_COLGC|nr:hypothetical protein CGLO_11973 [Colletotrichum gloeosporioides Cg-14]
MWGVESNASMAACGCI